MLSSGRPISSQNRRLTVRIRFPLEMAKTPASDPSTTNLVTSTRNSVARRASRSASRMRACSRARAHWRPTAARERCRSAGTRDRDARRRRRRRADGPGPAGGRRPRPDDRLRAAARSGYSTVALGRRAATVRWSGSAGRRPWGSGASRGSVSRSRPAVRRLRPVDDERDKGGLLLVQAHDHGRRGADGPGRADRGPWVTSATLPLPRGRRSPAGAARAAGPPSGPPTRRSGARSSR